MKTESYKLNKEQLINLKNKLNKFLQEKKIPYVDWQAKTSDCTITCYSSGKVVFQGEDLEVYTNTYKKQTSNTKIYPMAGSDEVGTGDFFGPICVCAAIVREKDLPLLKQTNVQDSKAITDQKIREIAPLIMQQIPYSLLILSNEKYNEIIKQNNMNKIKALLHNQAYINLKKKIGLPANIIIDQFATPKLYYQYLSNEKEIISNIHFETKAENKYLAVACGSIIARYAFLLEFDKLEKKYSMPLTKGASAKTDQNAANFVKKYGFDQLKMIAKLNFKNTEKLKQYL